MDLTEYRASSAEQQRTRDLLDLMPASGATALDIGARDGHFSVLLAERFASVVALDLEKPGIEHPRIVCVRGNAAKLEYPDRTFDFVLCAEVLEHIPPEILPTVCREIERVCRGTILIGVPFRQDIRVGRTTCYTCMGKNPPWGHVNSFDDRRLAELFPGCTVERTTYVGENAEGTNALAAALMDFAGNPYGAYDQEEPCIHCGVALIPPPPRTISQKVFTKLAFWAQGATQAFARPRANWIHVQFARRGA